MRNDYRVVMFRREEVFVLSEEISRQRAIAEAAKQWWGGVEVTLERWDYVRMRWVFEETIVL